MIARIEYLIAYGYTHDGVRDKSRDEWITERNVDVPDDPESRWVFLEKKYHKAIQIKVCKE